MHLGETEGVTPAPDLQSIAPDTRPLSNEAPTEHAAGPATESVQLTRPTESSAPPVDPSHGLPPIRDLEDEESTFATAVPKQPSTGLPVEPTVVPPTAPVVMAFAPVAIAFLEPAVEQYDSIWMRHETNLYTLSAPVPCRRGHTRRTQAEPAGPTP